ncbi:hypothetical protein GO988_08050 [Hymenobacter sp. HMF4947]|uniref:Uncharacterized protein n=1 Tax=Hymenobacter ginkgonis TaxID=2682976 RepID=A0A7K1TCZ6_9BACT|nr:hypothetical protein [Hymenobacter ginkgonis]MVN76274.1 hypothetical protein [Hymenobacter ginkgonis]
MASPHFSVGQHASSPERRYRRSAFNGAKQLEAAGAKHRRVLWIMGLLTVALVGALVVVAVHLAGGPK